jgi:hypothetical protein
MTRTISITLTLALNVPLKTDREEFYESLEAHVRNGFGDLLPDSLDNLFVIATTDPEGILESHTNLQPMLWPRHEIAVVWTIEDVEELRPDLTADQCWSVLQECERTHDAGDGINWHALDATAEAMFGPEPEPVEATP